MERTHITIIGAGVIGLAVARLLAKDRQHIIVLERNGTFGQETSSRNSEVVHAGLYYPRTSLKSDTCIRGKELLYELCAERGIAHKKIGKLVVATGAQESEALHTIYENARACGVTDCRFLTRTEIAAREPAIKVKEAFFSPDSGIIDTHGVMKNLYDEARYLGVDFAYGVETVGIERSRQRYRIVATEPDGSDCTFESDLVINAAGLKADAVAAMAGIDIEKHEYTIHFCKGQYFRIADPSKYPVTHLVYPPPTDYSLGIHIAPDLAGGLRLGPDAHYVDSIDHRVDPAAQKDFHLSVRTFLPTLKYDDLIQDTAGIRPKLQPEGGAFRDFVIKDEADIGYPGFIDLIGIESPGFTAALAIAEMVRGFIGS
ncbi:MAG: NAD(P)/FAD-dependent oxidoreductase [Candidatus Omnitrophica bacterium]|nr:NAD(P)/FAD-dependent oxidoreductase [Candidatus Omnitrophota bacterium]